MIKEHLLGLIEPTFAHYEFLGNTGSEYVLAIASALVFFILLAIFQMIILARLKVLAKRTQTDIDDTFIRIVSSLRPPFYTFIALYFGLQFLSLDPTVSKILDVILIIWIAYQIIKAIRILVDYISRKGIEEDTAPDEQQEQAVRFIGGLVSWILWGVAILMILSNVGVNITSLIAGLGIGGIAIAFALQNVLADLFSSFAIYFDKPFAIGDFIKVGDSMGVVKHVGIKTTRLTALSGEELVFSNRELTSTKIQNYGKMEERRIQFSIGVLYETAYEKVKEIPAIIKSAVDMQENTRFDRAHMKEFGNSALVYEVVYFVLSPDYNEYMDVQEKINLSIKRTFEEKGIEFAYPTQTLYLHKEE